MKQRLLNLLVKNAKNQILESVKSHTIYPKVQPKVGSIVHCSLYGVQHSGIYIGENTIVNLERTGDITAVTPKDFVKNTTALAIYVACDAENNVLHSEKIAQNAVHQIGKNLRYNVLINNCHKFTAGCILGDFNNLNLTFTALNSVIKSYFFNFDFNFNKLLNPLVGQVVDFADKLNVNLKRKNQNLYGVKSQNKNQISKSSKEIYWRIWDNEITPKNLVKKFIKT